MKTFTDRNGNTYQRTRWLTIYEQPVTKKHRYFEYSEDENGYRPTDLKFNRFNAYLWFIRFRGEIYPLNTILRCNTMFCGNYDLTDEDGNTITIHGLLGDSVYNESVVEIDTSGEHMRVYYEV